jgi:ubiquinone/menaquinone biosynthesis C-methylase UbiE
MYKEFAKVYDGLMKDFDYDYNLSLVNKYLGNSVEILDLACGTGNMSIPIAKKGLFVTGVDISEEMLMVANEKAYEEGLRTKFIKHDIVNINLKKKFDMVTCFTDGFNYISYNDFSHLVDNIKRHLKKNGILIFDLSSKEKLEFTLGNNSFCETHKDFSYIWENYYKDGVLEFDFTLFKKNSKGSYDRFLEHHTQYAYDKESILNSFKNGFEIVEISSDKDNQRNYYILRRTE